MVFLLSKTVLGDSHSFCVMIVLKKFRGSSTAFFYGFRVISIVSGCSQMDMDGSRPVTDGSSGSGKFWGIADGFEWMALLAFWWFWVVCYLNSYGYCIFPVSWHFFLKLFTRNSGQKYPQNFFCAFKF